MVIHKGFFVPVNMMEMRIQIVMTPPTKGAKTPNARAALNDEDTSLWGRDDRSEYGTHTPYDDWKLKIPKKETSRLPSAFIVDLLMKRQDDTARLERINPVKEATHIIILIPIVLTVHNSFCSSSLFFGIIVGR